MDAMHPRGSSTHAVSIADCARSRAVPAAAGARRAARAAFERDPDDDSRRGALPARRRRRDRRSLEPWRPVVTVCVHGHEVSQDAATLLRARGYDARSLDGGHEQWRAEGGATVAVARADALGDARAAEDRPHRVPVAGAPLRRSVGDVPLRAAARTCSRTRRRTAPRPTTCPDVDVHAPRRALQLRCVRRAARPRRSGARRARRDRARRRHRRARPRAARRRACWRCRSACRA